MDAAAARLFSQLLRMDTLAVDGTEAKKHLDTVSIAYSDEYKGSVTFAGVGSVHFIRGTTGDSRKEDLVPVYARRADGECVLLR